MQNSFVPGGPSPMMHLGKVGGWCAGHNGLQPQVRDGPCGSSVPEGVLDFRAGLFGVALGLVAAAFGPQAPVAGDPAGALLGAAFDRFGLVRDLLGDAHGWLTSRESSDGAGAPAGTSAAAGPAGTWAAGWPASGSGPA